jgi:hypothetical protein
MLLSCATRWLIAAPSKSLGIHSLAAAHAPGKEEGSLYERFAQDAGLEIHTPRARVESGIGVGL